MNAGHDRLVLLLAHLALVALICGAAVYLLWGPLARVKGMP